jgi:hypothetical protein
MAMVQFLLTQVIDNEICFKASNSMTVYELFHDRAMMFAKVHLFPLCHTPSLSIAAYDEHRMKELCSHSSRPWRNIPCIPSL